MKTHKTVEDFERDFEEAYQAVLTKQPAQTLWVEALERMIHYQQLLRFQRVAPGREMPVTILWSLARDRLTSVWACPGCIAATECSVHGKTGLWSAWLHQTHERLMAEEVHFCTQCHAQQHFYEKEPGKLHCRKCQTYSFPTKEASEASTQRPCRTCDGAGEVGDRMVNVCRDCNGTGRVYPRQHDTVDPDCPLNGNYDYYDLPVAREAVCTCTEDTAER